MENPVPEAPGGVVKTLTGDVPATTAKISNRSAADYAAEPPQLSMYLPIEYTTATKAVSTSILALPAWPEAR
jgi:hypothetical protein